MNIKTFLKKHPSLNQAEAIKIICEPLGQLGIIYFSHVHIDENFNMSCLATQPKFFKLYFDKGYYQYDLHMANLTSHEQFILWDSVQRKQKSKNLHEDFMSFNQGHTFSIVLNNGNTKDCFHFAGKLGQESINELYLQHIDALKKFILFFKDKVYKQKELAAAYALKIPLLQNQGGYLTKQPLTDHCLQKFCEAVSVHRYHIDGAFKYITHRELECLHWLANGKTAEEIASILSITTRTAKAHIINVKTKLNCRNHFQLGMIYQKIKSSLVDTV